MFSFSKMQATGNDFIIINYLENKTEYSYKLLSQFLCDRHFGVGADGIIIIEKSNIADVKMRIFNKDGSEAEMCGNGIRCLGKYIYEKKIINKENLCIETLAGIKYLKLSIEGVTVVKIEVDMGEAEFEYTKIPILLYKNEYSGMLHIEGMKIYPVSIGNPHAVCFVDDIDKVNLKKYGELIENYKYFPNRTNVEFVEIKDEFNIKVRIWERGVGETLSCGTGCCACAIVSNKYKSTNSMLNVDLLGGKLQVICEKKLKLLGDAEFVYEGKIEI